MHAASRAGLEGTMRLFCKTGQYGVQLFFVISAFTLLLSLSSRRERGDPLLMTNFFVRRLCRILPVYWFGILFYYFFYGLESRSLLAPPEPWHFVPHFLLLNVLHPETSSSVVPGGWSISLEILFYLMVPVLFLVVNKLWKACLLVMSGLVVFPFINHVLSQIFRGFMHAEFTPVEVYLFWYRSPFNQIGAFACGFLLFYLTKSKGLSITFSRVIVNRSFLIGSVVLMLILPFYDGSLKHLLFSLDFVIFAFMLSLLPSLIFVNSFFSFFGRISFSCYLLHFFVLKELTRLFSQADYLVLSDVGLFGLLLIMTIICTLPLALLSFRWIEVPAQSFASSVMNYLTARHADTRS